MSVRRGAFLEVDDRLLADRLNITGGAGDEPSHVSELTMPDVHAAQQRRTESLEIKPQPAACFKTRDQANNKVFVNLCTSELVPPPTDLSEEELQQTLQSDDPDTNRQFRVPMSLGAGHNELDKSGAPCVAYDVVIHPSFYAKMELSLLFHTFFVTVMMESIEEKFDIKLDANNWTALRNKRYYGTMPAHYIRNRDLPLVQEYVEPAARGGVECRPLISEVKTTRTAPPRQLQHETGGTRPLIAELQNTRKAPPPECHVQREAGGDRLRVTVDLAGRSAADLDLEVGEDRVLLTSSSDMLCDVFLPSRVLPETARAAYSLASRRLVVMVVLA